jgi:hypothetical protein
VEWVACYEAAVEVDARMVLALLEARGIPCRMEPLAASVFPHMGFVVLVPADRVDEARELIESQASPEEMAMAAEEPEVANPEPVPGRGLGPFQVVGRALRFIGAHPTVLLTGASCVLSGVVLEAIRSNPDREARTLDLLREHAPDFLLLVIVGTIVQGLTIAFVDGALDGRPSWTEAASRTKTQFVRLFASGIVVSLPCLVGTAIASSQFLIASPAVRLVYVLTTPVSIYVGLRLTFVSVALLVDRTDIAGAFRGSWDAAGRAWWVVLGLLVLGGIVLVPFAFSSWHSFTVEPLVSVVGVVAWVVAYRAWTDRPTAFSSIR